MKKYIRILFFMALLQLSLEVIAQEKKNLLADVAQDDLGNVTDEFQEYFFEALKQKAIENHEKAVKALVHCLALDPSQPVVYLELGKNHNAMEQFTQAAVYLEKARKAVPGNKAVLEELYRSYFLNQDFPAALPVVKELVEIDATFSDDLANLYLLSEKYEEALLLLDELDEEWGESTFRNNLRHQVYSRTGNVKGQIEDLRKRLLENPEEEKNYLNLIFVYSEEGEEEKAFDTAQRLLEIKPDSELVHLALYKFYLNNGETGKAVNSMKIVSRSDQIDMLTKYQALNDFLMFVSENPSLEKDLVEIVEIFSQEENNNKVYRELGTYFLEKGQVEQALDYFERALEVEDSNFDLFKNALLLQLDFGKYQEAAVLGKNAIERFPSQPLLYLLYASALNHMESYEEAADILNFGLDFVIDDVEMQANFYRQLAVTYRGLNNTEKAVEFEQKAAQLQNNKIDE